MIATLSPVALLVGLSSVIGVLIGSFLNVVIHRVPAGVSVVRPRSACPNCRHTIRAIDNIPVLSWVALGGRCRHCRTPISARYPAVELATAVLFALVTAWLVEGPGVLGGAGPESTSAGVLVLAYLYLMAISVALAMIDLDTRRLPNAIVLPAYPVLLVLFTAASAVSGDWGALVRALIGMSALGVVYLLLAMAVPGGMGLGDVKLAGVLGLALAYLGWGPLAVGSFAAFLLGGTFAIVLIAWRRAGRRSGIPFGPWMVCGAWVGIFFGSVVWDGYLSLIGLA